MQRTVTKPLITTIIMDLDGPILDGKERHYRCYSDILIENGFIPMPVDEYWQMKRMRLDRHQQLGVSGADGIYDKFFKSWLCRIEEREYLGLDRLQPGVIKKLKEWKCSDINIILATMRNNKDTLFWQLDLLSLLPLFDHVIVTGSVDGEAGKANAVKSYLKQGDMNSYLWIGDTEADINSARMLGIKVCAVGCGIRTTDYLASLAPDFLAPDVNSINLKEMRLI